MSVKADDTKHEIALLMRNTARRERLWPIGHVQIDSGPGELRREWPADYEQAWHDLSDEERQLLAGWRARLFLPVVAISSSPKLPAGVDAALALVARGWRVFPAKIVGKQKKSYVASKKKTGIRWGQSKDADEVRRLWKQFKPKCIGLATGFENKIFISEIDTKAGGHAHDGADALAVLERKHGKLPATLMVRSPSGSIHHYWRHPGADANGEPIKVWSSASALGPGIDVKGDNSMVVAAGSVRSDGAYTWINAGAEIADAPAWLLDLVTHKKRKEAPATSAANPADNPHTSYGKSVEVLDTDDALATLTRDGYRDQCLSISQTMANRGVPPEEIYDAMMAATEALIEREHLDWDIDDPNHQALLRDNIIGTAVDKVEGERKQERVAAIEISEKQALVEQERPWPVLHKDARHGISGEVLAMFDPHTEADPVALLMQLHTQMGNSYDRGPYYLVEGTKHYPVLFTVLVGNTSKSRKGTSGDRIKQLMVHVAPEWARNCIRGGMSSGEGIISQIMDHKKEKDEETNANPDADADAAPGAMRIHHLRRDDKRLYIEEGEFAQPLAVMKREGNTLSNIIRDAWNMRPVLRTMTRNNPLCATEPTISIVGHITETELKMMLDRTSMTNGYANRFLFTCVKRSKELPFGGNLSADEIEEMGLRLKEIHDKHRRIEKQITMDDAARNLWADNYHDLSADKAGLIGAITARSEAQVTRLALSYAILDCSDQIKPVHLKAGMAVWKYCEDSAAYIFGDSVGDPIADELLRGLVNSGGMSRKQISNHFQRHQSSEKIEAALAALEKLGKARRKTQSTGGRPVEWWTAVKGNGHA